MCRFDQIGVYRSSRCTHCLKRFSTGHHSGVGKQFFGAFAHCGIARPQQRATAFQMKVHLAEQYGFPSWVEVDTKRLQGTFKHVPERAELPPDIQEQLVVELYSK